MLSKVVDNYGRIGEGLRNNGIHAVREVYGDFFDLLSLFLWYLHKDIGDIRGLSPFYCCYHGVTFTMPFLVGQECHQILVKHSLVNAQLFAYVLRKQHPVLRMAGLFSH